MKRKSVTAAGQPSAKRPKYTSRFRLRPAKLYQNPGWSYGNYGPIHTWKRSMDLGNINNQTVTSVYGGFVFTLADLPSYSEFASLYDQFRMDKIVLTFFPQATEQQVASASITSGRIIYVVDWDTASAPASDNVLLEYENCKIRNFNEQFSVSIPNPGTLLSTIVTGGGGTGNTISRGQWVDIATPSIQFFGLRYALTPVTSLSLSGFRVYAKFYMSFRGQR